MKAPTRTPVPAAPAVEAPTSASAPVPAVIETAAPAKPAMETDPQDGRLWTIGELAAELGLTTRAIRFYEARGLIAPMRRGVARCYSRRDRGRMLLILRGKNLGFTLDDIKEYLELYDADPAHRAQLQLLAAKVDAHIADLDRKRADIERTLAELKEIRAQVEAQFARQERKPD